MQESHTTTGDWIRAELEAKGWKVDDLSYEAHIPARLIWKYLAGTEPGAQNLARIVQAFGYDAPWTTPLVTDTRPGSSLDDLWGIRRWASDLTLVSSTG